MAAIRTIQVDHAAESRGLAAIRLEGMSDVVLLCGKNGSGKSRVLAAIAETVRERPRPDTYQEALSQIRRLEDEKVRMATRLPQLLSDRENQKAAKQNLAKIDVDLARVRKDIQTNTAEISRFDDIVVQYERVSVTPKHQARIVYAVPKSTTLRDDRKLTDTDRVKLARLVSEPGTSGLDTGTLALVRQVQDRWFNSTHPHGGVKDDTAVENYARLRDLIFRFLGAELGRNSDGYPTLFGKHILETHLSDGQTILLQLAVEIYAQAGTLSDVVLFLDEPENHLHPHACVNIIQSIRLAIPDSQVWIATHSLPILSFFHDATLLLVQNGNVERCGTRPEAVLSELIGEDESVFRLRDFMNLPSIYAMNRFAAECLLPPRVVGGGKIDDQTRQIREHVDFLNSTKNAPLRLLDFGAGKGRVLENLVASHSDVGKKIDYFAIDSSPEDEAKCQEIIAGVYGSKRRHFPTIQSLLGTYDRESFDIMLMCNVLHEIDPKDWLSLFGKNGEMAQALAETGNLLIVEDEQIPVGEKAYQKGFIVLDTAALKTLFRVRESDGFVTSELRSGRLKAHLIPKECMSRIDAESRKRALEGRARAARTEIKKLREEQPSYLNGRRHGFWVQQLANVVLALEELV